MTSELFSPLSKGYGSWEDGDLQAQDNKTLPRPILPNLLEAEDVAFKDKSLNIPLRTKTSHSMVAELVKTKNVMPPPEETYTVYSRPKTATTTNRFSSTTPRAQIAPTRISRAKSAPPDSARHEKPIKPNGELVLPKTFLTRRGAMLLFTAPDDLKFSQEQKCYQAGQDGSADIFDLGLKLKTMNKLTASVLQYGQEMGPGTDFESYSSHYDKTFTKFPREVDDETAMDIHAQPGGDYSFYLRDLQVRTQGGLRYRPSSGRSVTSDVERAELTEELRKMDAGDAGSHGYLISADVNQLTEPYMQQSQKSSSGLDGKVSKTRKPTSAKGVLSAMKLAASLKSANYLGRSAGSPYIPMTITPWERVDTPSDLVDVPLAPSSPLSRPTTADLISLRSRRSLASAGSGVGQRSDASESAIQGQGDEVFETTEDEPIKDMYIIDEPTRTLNTAAVGKEETVEPIAKLDRSVHSDNVDKVDEQSVVDEQLIVDVDDNIDIDINIYDDDVEDEELFNEGLDDEIWPTPGMVEPGLEDKGALEAEDHDKAFDDGRDVGRPASVPVSMATEEEEEDVWIGQQVDEERPPTAMSAGELENLEQQRVTTTPVSERTRSAASSRKPSVAGSEKARSVGSRPASVAEPLPGSRAASRPGSVVEPSPGSGAPSRTGSAAELLVAGNDMAVSGPGSGKVESGIGSERAASVLGSVQSEADNEGVEESLQTAQPLQAPYQVMTTGDEAGTFDESQAEPIAEDATDTLAEYTAEPTTDEPTPLGSGDVVRPATTESQKPVTPGSEVNSIKSLGDREKEKDEPAKSTSRKLATKTSGVPSDVLVIPQEKSTANQKEVDKSANQKASLPPNQKPETPPSAKKLEPAKTTQDTKKQDTSEKVTKSPTPPKQAKKTSVTSPRSSVTVPPRRPVSAKKETPPPPQKKEGLDLSELKSLVTKKDVSSEKSKGKKVAPPKKERKKKGSKMQFVDSLGIESYEPSKEEIEQMVQEELAKQLAAKNLSEIVTKESEPPKSVSVASKGDSGVDTAVTGETESIAQQNEAEETEVTEAPILNSDEEDANIEAELKEKFGEKMKNKKSKKQINKERAALKEAKLQERKRKEEERKELIEKKKQKEEEKRRQIEEQKRRKMMAEEDAMDAAREAEEARQAEEEARQMLQDARRKAREEREAKRKAEIERRKHERDAQREERRRMEEDARKREKEMLDRLASAEERRRLREEEEEREWEREEQLRLEEEERQMQEEEERKRMEEEEDKIRELERQAEEEAMARLIRDRLEAEERRRQAQEDAERQRIEEEMRRQEELLRQQEEEERRLKKELENRRRLEEEKLRLQEIQRIEMEARERVRQEIEKRRAELMKRREQNLEHRDHLQNVRQTQGLTRPWVFSYYVHWPRDTYEKPLPSNDDKKKKKGFRPKAKAKPKTS